MSSTSTTGTESVPQEDRILEMRDVSVTYGMDRGESKVLDSVDADIQREEIFGIVGESGSGKSMFASSVLDAVPKPGRTSGEITFYPEDGDPIDVLSQSAEELRSMRWEEISMVFQGAMSSFNPVMTLRKHFEDTLEAHDYDKEQGMEDARELLSELYLEPDRVLSSYPHELSGGMTQRALIALSLVLKPQVLVMDEPTAALDLLMQRSILSLLHNLKDRYNLTILYISHDLPQVVGLADRIGVLYAFQFVEISDADEILQSASHPYTRELVNSVPNLDADLDDMQPIEGAAPDPVNIPKGCSYHPRCSMATKQCREADPNMYEVNDDHTSACHYWDDVDQEIPLANRVPEDGSVDKIPGNQSPDIVSSLEDVEVHFEQSSGLFDWGESHPVRAVDGVDLDIYGNDVVALVGESGCGKTTLGKTTIAVERPTGGSVKYRGQDVWDSRDRKSDVDIPFEAIRRALQIVHQDPGSALNSNKTIKTILSAPLKKWRPDLDAQQRLIKIQNMLEHVGMTPPDDYANRWPHQLSGGEKQRVALIRALLMNPDLTLLDEAVSALDVSLRIEVMDLLLEMQELFNTSYLFISHNFANARYLTGKAGGRIGVMYLGQIVEIGEAEDIVQNPKHPYTKVLRWATADMEGETVDKNPPIRDIDIPDPVDPPSGCSFHTRCPVAREVCKEEEPGLGGDASDGEHNAACFRELDNHEYWESEPLEGTQDAVLESEEAPNQAIFQD